jgi:hypothetical protein
LRLLLLLLSGENKVYLDIFGNIIKVTKLRVRVTGHVAHIEQMINAYSILVLKPEDRSHPRAVEVQTISSKCNVRV